MSDEDAVALMQHRPRVGFIRNRKSGLRIYQEDFAVELLAPQLSVILIRRGLRVSEDLFGLHAVQL